MRTRFALVALCDRKEKVVEGVKEQVAFSPVESTLIDPISYLSSRCCVCEKQCYVKDCLTLQELILPSTAVL